MFEQMLESSPVKRRHTSPWAFVISTTLQAVFVGVLILIPLLYTEAIDLQGFSSTWLAAPPPPPPPPPPAAAQPVRRVRQTSLMEAGKLRAPKEIPREIVILKEEPMPADMGGVAGGVPGGVPGGQIGGVLGGVIGGVTGVAPPPPKAEAPQRIRVSSGVQEAKLINKVTPAYPPLASRARIQGTVQLQAIIGKDGTVQNLRVIDGHPMLVQSAVQAVQQWRYQPTVLNNEPVEVETVINVVFKLY